MKNVVIVILAVLLAAALIIGSILYTQHFDNTDALKDELSQKDTMVGELQGKIESLRSEAEAKVKELENNCEGLVSGLKTQLLSRDTAVRELQGRIERLKSEAQTEIGQLKTTQEGLVSGLRTQLVSKDVMLREFKGKIATETNERDRLQRQLSVVGGEKNQLRERVQDLQSAHNAVVSELRGQIERREVTVGRLKEKLSITFVDRILFEFGKASITLQGKEVLKKVGEILKNVQAKQIRVVGHTDNIPIKESYRYKFSSNWELSAARASAVVRYFQEEIGLDPINLEAVGRSFYEPVASNETQDGRAHNRRVHIIIAPKIEQE